jgi:hypothetical protein
MSSLKRDVQSQGACRDLVNRLIVPPQRTVDNCPRFPDIFYSGLYPFPVPSPTAFKPTSLDWTASRFGP